MEKSTVEQTLQIALQHNLNGQLEQAKIACRQILDRQPDQAAALHLIGIVSAKTGQTGPALDFLRQAISIKPNWAEAHYDCGNVLQSTGQLEEAIAMYRRALSFKPDWPEAHNNLGVALQENGRPAEAAAEFRRVIAIRPADPKAHINLGNALKNQGLLDQSISAFHKAIALKPNSSEAHNNLAVALRDNGQLEQSMLACRSAIALQPDFADARNNLGVVLEDMGQSDDALIAYQQAAALRPNYAQAHYNIGNALKNKGQLSECISAYRTALALKPQFIEADNNLVYTLHFHPAYDAKAIGDEHRRWNLQHAEPLKKFAQPHSNDRDANRQLRIGYVSPDFREHPVGRFLLPLFTEHDRTKFEIFAYSHVIYSDEVTERLRSHTDKWQSIAGLSDEQAADLIRRDNIDILIDLTMHMARNRLLVFARKPAPVQLSWLAYCSTTGLDAIDYRLSDPYLDPIGVDESVYSEQTIHLPQTYWCYEPPIPSAQVSALPAVKNGYITFGSLNNFAKVSEPALMAWAKILRAIPNAHLLIRVSNGSQRQQLLDRLKQEQVEPDRIQFAERAPLLDYLNLYHHIDIALDTFPYAGGTITCDALWMGVPIVSLIGKTAVGRGGLSILSNIGLPELAATSEERYVDVATQLAADLPRLNKLRLILRQQMEQSSLMDAPRFARHMESAYRQMWQRWCAIPR